MVTTHRNRALLFVECEIRSRLGWIIVLEIIAGMIVLVFGEQQKGILWRDLLFDSAVPFDAVEFVVGTDSSIMLVVQVQSVACVPKAAEVRGEFPEFVVAAPARIRDKAGAIGLKQPGVLLLGNVLRENASANGRKHIGQQQFVKPWGFVAQVETRWIAQGIIA